MRAGLMLVMVLLALPSAAMAQGRTAGGGTPMGDLLDLNRFATRGFMNQWAATRPAALSGLSRASRTFIKAEVQRQAESPRPVSAVAATIEDVMARDIRIIAKSDRIDPADIKGAVLLKILVDTHSALEREAKRNPAVAPGQRPWEERILEADLNVREALAAENERAIAMVRD